MTSRDTPAMPARLAFGTTFRAAFGTVFGRLGRFVKVAAAPLLLSSALLVATFALRASSAVGALVIDPYGLVAALLELALGLLALLPLASLGIGLTRLTCIGRGDGAGLSTLFDRRTLIYAGYLLLLMALFVALAVAGFFAVIALLEASDAGDDARAAAIIIGGILGLSVLLYLLLRFSLVLPAVALDQKLGLIGSWRMTRRSGAKLFSVFFVLFLVLIVTIMVGSVITGSGEVRIGTPHLVLPAGSGADSGWMAIVLANLPRNLWNLVVNFVIFAMGCGAMASAYAQLSGWSGPREELLERFE